MTRTLIILGLFLSLIWPAAAQSPTRNVSTSQVSVAATATLTAGFRANRQAVTIQNHGTTVIYCGSSNAVTTGTGFRLPGVDGASLTIPSQANIFCLTTSGSQTVSVVESY